MSLFEFLGGRVNRDWTYICLFSFIFIPTLILVYKLCGEKWLTKIYKFPKLQGVKKGYECKCEKLKIYALFYP